MIPLGAINKKTREYVYPKIANKKDHVRTIGNLRFTFA